MAQVLMSIDERTTRAPTNPLDKSTIVSIYPKSIDETKHTIEPGRFHLDAGSYDKPALLTVGPSSWWKKLEEKQPLLEIPISSIMIADSIVRDWANGLLACNMGDCMPGIFFIPGSFTSTEVKTKYKEKLDEYQTKQRNWYQALVKMGDVLWARSSGNPLSISADMRLAAVELNLTEKDWLKDHQITELVRCIACSTLIQANVIICPNCKVVLNKKRFDELKMEFAR